jgi:hypothetical protein
VNGGWPVGLERKKREGKRKKERKKRKGNIVILLILSILYVKEKPFCQTFSDQRIQSSKSRSIKEPEPELFLEEAEPCQTGLNGRWSPGGQWVRVILQPVRLAGG